MGFLKVCLVFCLTIVVVVENRRITKLERLENVLKRTNKILNDLKREVAISDETACVDEATKCEEWKTRDGDRWEKNCQRVKFLQSKCKKTCNLCGTTSGGSGGTGGTGGSGGSGESGDCTDLKEDCPKWKANKGDEEWAKLCQDESRPWLARSCKKTCDLCDGGSGGSGGTDGSGGSGGTDGSGGSGGTDGSSGGTGGSGGSGGPTTTSSIEECNDQNKGHCECGEAPFKTYVFKIDDETRCFTVYRPDGYDGEKLPIVFTSQCYGKDRLTSIGMKNTRTGDNVAAGRYGFARIGLSTPDGAWTFGNDGIVNDDKPMPCSEADSKDISYLNKVFEFIDANAEIFDADRIYAEGFSQNSMFSAYIGFCYSDRVTGIWQGGSGLALKSQENVNLPGKQSKCSASSFAEHSRQCETEEPCTDCTYWPIYPCYQPKKPMIDCIADYTNDYIANARSGDQSTTVNMYEAASREGHDARMLRFSASDDGTIPGGHKNPRNTVYWQMGCWGMTEKCSSECESSFEQCVSGKDVSTAEEKVTAFENCIKTDVFKDLAGCAETCSPTFNMLKQSEKVVDARFTYGDFDSTNYDEDHEQPLESKCKAAK